jgi:hypothetical protein
MAYCRDFGVTPEGEEITQPCPAKGRASCCNGSQLISEAVSSQAVVRAFPSISRLGSKPREPGRDLGTACCRCTPGACTLIFTIIIRHCMMCIERDASMGTTKTLIVAAPHQMEASCPCNGRTSRASRQDLNMDNPFYSDPFG